MKLAIQLPNRSLNKAYLKEKVSRNDIEIFKTNLKTLLSKIDHAESEEHHKYPVADFLNNTWYKDNYEINTKSRADFVIHNGKTTKDTTGVIIEVKSPSNLAEMISDAKPNKKAMHELILYYLRERVDANQTEIKHLIITNIWEWYVFDEKWFEENIFRGRLKKEYETYKHSGKDTKFFFDSIAKPFLYELTEAIPCAYFDLHKYETILRNDNKNEDNKLIALYKLLSPAHLLKQPFANDSNSLDTKFYAELLHIIGLEEVKDGSKKLILQKGKPDTASLLESVMMKLDDKDCIRNINSAYGNTNKDKLFNVALELCITWINRILFIKLLEGQLVTYHKGDKDYLFLNTDVIHDFNELNTLFFQVLAEQSSNRHDHLKNKFRQIPYLNSSLFDRTPLERQTIEIAELDNRLELPVSGSTVLKNEYGKRRSGKLRTLQYLFDFLDAYDFSSDGGETIQEENKNLINASVLGLIFEKINGYKDGSFFTPGFVTMYMCCETIRRAVLQKFNDVKGWQCETIDKLYDKITDKKEANSVINSLKICDPAVGSGHFLVSALNEVIAIKSELKILLDRQGKTLRDYTVTVENDALVVTDEDGQLLDYNPRNKESQRIQEALFHEKETIIESCLFGVDINPNSVKICRLRLWIELLKNAYYTTASNFTELETLPNIDINIKCGNSLISRFALDADLSKALRKSKWTIDTYRIAVQNYRNAESKEEKREMEELIENIKSNFRSEISDNDPKVKRLQKLNTDYYLKYQADKLFDAKLTTAQKKDKQKFEADIEKLDTEIKEIKSNKIYENAFEWRFEFPEVLDDDGKFLGFDIVIGNPPYGVKFNQIEKIFFAGFYSTIDDIYSIFIEKGVTLTKSSGYVSLIIPVFWLTGDKYFATRNFIYKNSHLELGVTLPYDIFADAYVDTGIYIFSRNKSANTSLIYEFEPKEKVDFPRLSSLNMLVLKNEEWENESDLKVIFNPVSRALTKKINEFKYKVGEITDSIRGILANEEDYAITALDKTYKPIFVGKIDRYFIENNKLGYIKYGDNLKEKPSSYNYFTGERIIIRRIISRQFRIMATLTDKQFVVKKDAYIFKLTQKKFSSKYLLSIINSKLISFIKTKGSAAAKKDDFTQITLNDIRQLRIPEINNEQNEIIENIVDKLFEAKRKNDSNIAQLEYQLDQLVYQLYGLTEEEIKIVEGM